MCVCVLCVLARVCARARCVWCVCFVLCVVQCARCVCVGCVCVCVCVCVCARFVGFVVCAQGGVCVCGNLVLPEHAQYKGM